MKVETKHFIISRHTYHELTESGLQKHGRMSLVELVLKIYAMCQWTAPMQTLNYKMQTDSRTIFCHRLFGGYPIFQLDRRRILHLAFHLFSFFLSFESLLSPSFRTGDMFIDDP